MSSSARLDGGSSGQDAGSATYEVDLWDPLAEPFLLALVLMARKGGVQVLEMKTTDAGRVRVVLSGTVDQDAIVQLVGQRVLEQGRGLEGAVA